MTKSAVISHEVRNKLMLHRRPFSDNLPVPARTTATMDINLIRMFRDGPEVSLNGSPIVSPITAAS